jgi:hypothetical protein
MDLNHIEFPAALIANLYHSSLIEDETGLKKTIPKEKVFPADEITGSTPWKSLGNNQKNILIVLKSNEAVHLTDKDLAFLTDILGACKLGLADVSIVNLKNHPDASYKEITSFFKSKIVFLFDVEPASFGLPMSFPLYQIQSFAGSSFLFSPSLGKLENDKVEKSKLWVSLKRLFNL